MLLKIKDKTYPIPTTKTITGRQSVEIAKPVAEGGFGVTPANLAAAYDEPTHPLFPAAWLALCWLALSNAAPEDRVCEPGAVWDLAYGDYDFHLEPHEVAEIKAREAAEAGEPERPTEPAGEPDPTEPPGSPTSTGL